MAVVAARPVRCGALPRRPWASCALLGTRGRGDSGSDLAEERVGGREPQRDARPDDERGVDQADEQEHLGLQFAHQFGLAGGGFEVLATHDADADASAQGAQADDETRFLFHGDGLAPSLLYNVMNLIP